MHYRRETLERYRRELDHSIWLRSATDDELIRWAGAEARGTFAWSQLSSGSRFSALPGTLSDCKFKRRSIESSLAFRRPKEAALKAFDDNINQLVSRHCERDYTSDAFKQLIEGLDRLGIYYIVAEHDALTLTVNLGKERLPPPAKKVNRIIGPSCIKCGKEQIADCSGGRWYWYCIDDGCSLYRKRFIA
jgi:hypothetical protein